MLTVDILPIVIYKFWWTESYGSKILKTGN